MVLVAVLAVVVLAIVGVLDEVLMVTAIIFMVILGVAGVLFNTMKATF